MVSIVDVVAMVVIGGYWGVVVKVVAMGCNRKLLFYWLFLFLLALLARSCYFISCSFFYKLCRQEAVILLAVPASKSCAGKKLLFYWLFLFLLAMMERSWYFIGCYCSPYNLISGDWAANIF